jgi:uncharacterized membrane protein YvbJ
MKNECDIVKDLLFSYNDNILSNTSKKFVENHLKECDECKKALEQIQEDSDEKNPKKELDFLRKIRHKICRKNTIIAVVSVCLIAFIIFNIQAYKNYQEVSSTIQIYLEDGISDQELENIKNKITEKDSNAQIEYISKQQELEKIKSKMKDNQNVLDEYNEENNPLPASFEIKTNADIKNIVDSIQEMPGIAQIVTYINANPYELYLQNK